MWSNLLSNLLRGTFYYNYRKCNVNSANTWLQLNRIKNFSTEKKRQFSCNENVENDSHNLAGSIGSTHKVFDDEDAEIIFDVNERRNTINLEDLKIEEEQHDPYQGINLDRGISGVFEIEDLVTLLQRDNAKDIFVATVSPELSYVDYIVVVTGKSYKHMIALATFIRKVYKLKRHKSDCIPKIEGQNSKDWQALDLGNIALHIFSNNARSLYDLETLWTVGSEFDDKSKPFTVDIMEQYNAFLTDLVPLEKDDENNDTKESCNK